MREPLILGTGSHSKFFNTTDKTNGAPITLAGTPSLCARINYNTTEVTAGLTLTVDFDSKTGLHRAACDIDNGTLALAANDAVDVQIAAGTVDSVSVVGRQIWGIRALAGGLSAAEKADIDTEVAASLAAYNTTGVAKESTSQAIAGYIDTEVATLVTNVATILSNVATILARVPIAPIAVTIGVGSHTTGSILASNATGYGNDRLNGRPMRFLTGTLAGQLVKITDYVSATGQIDFQNILGLAVPAAPSNGDTAVIE